MALKRKLILAPGQKVTIFSPDGKTCRGEWTVKEVIDKTVYFKEPLVAVGVGDQMWCFENNNRREEYTIQFKHDCTLYFAASTVFVKAGSKIRVVERKGK